MSKVLRLSTQLSKQLLFFFPRLSLVPQQVEPQQKDEYWGEPGESSLAIASDYHTGKAGTDFVITGSACSHDMQEVSQMDVSLDVAGLHKTIRVFGDRVWERGRPTHPQPFTQMPLTYERAFGGTLLVDGQVHRYEEANPVGVGFCADLTETDVEGWPLPNMEYPNYLMDRHNARVPPAGFAPVAPYWHPRTAFSGTYDEYWQRHRAPYLPEDYQPRFMNMAPEDQIFPEFLRGGEPVSILGMHSMGELNFQLPKVELVNRVQMQSRELKASFDLETVHVYPNQLQLSMVWRSAFPCGRHSRTIRQISVNMSR